jgi:purine/pyrimidine-nucleoside phosphorylase
MLKVNEYFDGKVKSIALNNSEGQLTAGVMEAGDYEFGTSQQEEMTVVSGALQIQLPGESSFTTYSKGQRFNVAAGVKFQVKVAEQTAYLCRYFD